jgi:hypothetical protein
VNDDELPAFWLFAGNFSFRGVLGFWQPLPSPVAAYNSLLYAMLLVQPSVLSVNYIFKVSSACFADQGWISCSTLPMHFRA